jgi:O-acetyl-ADP-ribose deacetylase (regulator of RNase III)
MKSVDTLEAEPSQLLPELCEMLAGKLVSQHAHEQRRWLTVWLTLNGTELIPEQAWPLLDQLWKSESRAREVAHVADLPCVSNDGTWTDTLSIWRGDITLLDADVIVNAANSALTGCYQPFHSCVDNAIHTAAGPRLRQACEKIMGIRKRSEPTGAVTETPGFFLPSKYVFHTVGPIVSGDKPSTQDEALLQQCYKRSLERARQLQVGSIAFCAISTGVFGYPKSAAARVALRAIRRSMSRSRELNHVILVAFTDADEATLKAALREEIE